MFDIFSFSRKASSDPLTSLKAVTLWMKSLPLGDVYVAHEKVVKALVEFNEKQEPFSSDRLGVLMHLDEHAREMQRVLCQQYLRNPRMSKVIESRLWNAVHSFYWEVTRGYHAFIMDYVAHPSGSNIKSQIPLITARAIHDFVRMFKWSSFRYEDVDERLWKRLHNLYRFAEFERFEKHALILHQGDEPTSCVEQYVHALMLDTATTGAFYPKQVELLDSWLNGWTRMLPLEKSYVAERHVYCVNTHEGHGARRIRKVEDEENCRFWDTSALIAHIEELRAQLLNGEVPARLGLSEDCRLPVCLDFLDDIARMWAPKVQRVQRKHERNPVMQMIEVVHGLPGICAEIKQDNENSRQQIEGSEQEVDLSYEELVDFRLYGFVTKRTQARKEAYAQSGNQIAVQLPVHERWVVENESDRGYGATIDEVANDWIHLGKLVGFKPERTAHWRVGIIRRMHKHAAGQHYVGIEIISDTPVTVMLVPRQPKTSSGYLVNGVDAVNVIQPIAAVFMPGDVGGNERGSLIVDSAEYAGGRMLEMRASTKSFLIRLKDVLEKGDDWLQCGFDVVSKA